MTKTWRVPVVGDKLRGTPRLGHRGELGHVLAVIDTPNDGIKVVSRRWFKHKRRWQYDVLDECDFLAGLWRIESR